MAVKYVKDFDFPSSAGFHSGAKGYAKGGAVKAPTRTKSTMKREMTQSNKLSSNGALPRISDMDVNKQSGGAGKKLMPGYKAGGPIKAASGVFVTPRRLKAKMDAGYAAENARIEAEEARPINRLKKAFENTSADISQGFKTKIKRPFLKAVAKAGPRIERTLSKIPNKKVKALGLGAAALGAGAASLMGDDDEADMEMDDIPVAATRRTENLSAPVESEDVPVTLTKEIKSVTAPVKKAASKPNVDYDKMSAMDAVIAYNKLHNKDFDKSMEQQIRDRFASPSEGGMKRGGKVSKYADGGDATYGASMTSQERAKAKRGVDPYEDRTRGFGASMTDAEAEAASKGLREKYGKKEDKPVMHPGGRQRFLLNQTEKTPMKSGGASKAKVSQNMVALRATGAMNPSFGKKTPMKSGGKAEASKSDMQQDRALMARHNRLMHPDQKSKLKNGGKSVPSYSSKPLIKKSGGGGCNY
jgi:hypothetical protein